VTRNIIAIAAALAAGIGAAATSTPALAQSEPQLEHVFTITAELDEVIQVGETVRGNRRIIPITGGSVEGEGISGTIIPGAWDWQIDRPDGCLELEADYFIRTDDDAVINVVNNATICPPEDGEMRGGAYTMPKFEPPVGTYQWLGSGVFVGQLTMATDHPVPAVRIRIYRVR